MKLSKHAHLVVIALALLACLAVVHGCVSAGRVDAHGAKVNALVDAVNADATVGPAVWAAVESVAEDQADMSGSAHSMVHAAAGGDWKTLLVQLGVGALGLGATGVATYKKVNKDRDATSTERTAEDLVKINAPVFPEPKAAPVA